MDREALSEILDLLHRTAVLEPPIDVLAALTNKTLPVTELEPTKNADP